MAKTNIIRSRTSSASASTKTTRNLAMAVKNAQTRKAGRKRTAKKIVSRINAMKPKKPPTAFFFYLILQCGLKCIGEEKIVIEEMEGFLECPTHFTLPCEELEDFRKEYQEQNPDVKAMRDIGKACGVKWNTMTYEEKVKYYDIATEKRAEFDLAMANFTKKMENGEFDEDDPDLDDDSELDG